MMNDLVSRIESLRMALKHAPEQVDLDQVRDVLGEAGCALSDVTSLRQYTGLSIESRVDGLHDLQLTVTLERDELGPIIAWLHDLEM